MATRNVKTAPAFDPSEKLQSNTLKRQPNPDWSKSDLLRLLSYFEGELQARDITIAALRAEKSKQLYYQAKYGRFGLGDPFMALQRDSDNTKDNTFDEPAIKAMYDNQLAQLENLIATQRKAQLKMREQLANSEKRVHKMCGELEEEKRKHAQDTAQGDDVTYMLEKERERLKQEIDYGKAQIRRLEKDLKKTLACLEEERACSAKHKQVAIMLIKERKQIFEKVSQDKLKINLDGKDAGKSLAEGILPETSESLKMEAAMEKQLSEFDIEREQLRSRLAREENKTRDQSQVIETLQRQVESLTVQLQNVLERSASRESIQSIEMKSSVTPNRVVSPSPTNKPLPKTAKPVLDSRLASQHASLTADASARSRPTPLASSTSSPGHLDSNNSPAAVVTDGRISPRPNMAAGNTSAGSQSGNKAPLLGGQANMGSPRKTVPGGRGTPPPLPPNKPVLAYGSPGTTKPAPPPKVGITISKDRITVSGAETVSSEAGRSPAQKPVQIPVSVVGGQTVASSSRSTARDGSPIRKNSQSWPHQASVRAHPVASPSSPNLDFLGPEMADLQQLLTSMTEGEANPSDPSSLGVIPLTHFTSSSFDIHNSAIHNYAACGLFDALKDLVVEKDADVNLPLKDGTTPVHCAVYRNHEACLQLLLNHGGNANALRDNQTTPLHIAAEEGYFGCMKLLLEKKASVGSSNLSNNLALHLAALNGHTKCCCLLLKHGAKIHITNSVGFTALHCAVFGNHSDCLRAMLTHGCKRHSTSDFPRPSAYVLQIINMVDKNGQTIGHLAASRESEECLRVLYECCELDIDKKDKHGQSPYSVASTQCKEYLDRIAKKDQPSITTKVGVCSMPQADGQESLIKYSFLIGTVDVTADLPWYILEEKLRGIFTAYLRLVDTGVKVRVTSGSDSDNEEDSINYSLGLHKENIAGYQMNQYRWTPGTTSDKLPYELLCNSKQKKISILLQDDEEISESLAFEVLYPVQVIHNYIRLLEQYKSVVFYGPPYTGKTYLTKRLAQCIANNERNAGKVPVVHYLPLKSTFTNQQFLSLLKEKECIKRVDNAGTEDTTAPILLLDDLEIANVAELFGELLSPIEHRGRSYTFRLKGDSNSYYLSPNFYLITTMNKNRSTGLELSIQQRFRWVHFRMDSEPLQNLLARHLQRRLLHLYEGRVASPDDPITQSVEWVIAISHRINDSLQKLGMHDVVFGPCFFFSCPVEEKSEAIILSWVKELWNKEVSPVISDAVKRNTSAETPTERQQKITNTTLFVLMQKSIMLGCPLTGKEKDKYLADFKGGNELDIPLNSKTDNRNRTPGVTPSSAKDRRASTSKAEKDSKQSTPHKEVSHKPREPSKTPPGQHSKRRSLSASCVERTNQVDKSEKPEAETFEQDIKTKIPKLEVKSSVVLPLATPFKKSGSHSTSSDSPSHSKKHHSAGTTHHRQSGSALVSKKSHSSENISASGLFSPTSRLRLPSNFNFSSSPGNGKSRESSSDKMPPANNNNNNNDKMINDLATSVINDISQLSENVVIQL